MTDSLLDGPIAVTFSGGGYRATGFHLGTLAYLDRVDLAAEVKLLSTVSGGTITGAAWALSRARDESFGDFFRSLYDRLLELDLVAATLDRLATGALRVPSGRRDLSIAIADVYSRALFARPEDGEPYRFATLLDAASGLDELCFNATEFRGGLAFRFQRTTAGRGKIGNGKLWIAESAARQLRVGDIVAASACFPGGFEPLAFPTDFVWPDDRIPDLGPGFTDPASVALMDGGVYDNQGIDSLLLAIERLAPEPAGLILICDVDPPRDELYALPPTGDDQGPSLGLLDHGLLLLQLLSATTALVIATHAWWNWRSRFELVDLFLYVVPLFLAALTSAGLWWGRRLLRREFARRIPHAGAASWRQLRHLRLGQLLDMGSLRFGSLLAMASSVFMKRIRSLTYRRVFASSSLREGRLANMIHHLTHERRVGPGGQPPASEALRATADAATRMATQLWLDAPGQLANLVACGQATTCANLLRWLPRRFGRERAAWPPAARALEARLSADWARLNDDPHALLRELRGDV